ncbi:hypothetical protein VP01_1946g5 [Puccinia sorghi]|uniref:Uncharacterized protein n=1 Tax=Puccinia sorghi TaxID=27349 RepID=A0A0L6VC71_9BASI|nr:hypothetical protein VP01_1946g5 [Puccinia sorghi]
MRKSCLQQTSSLVQPDLQCTSDQHPRIYQHVIQEIDVKALAHNCHGNSPEKAKNLNKAQTPLNLENQLRIGEAKLDGQGSSKEKICGFLNIANPDDRIEHKEQITRKMTYLRDLGILGKLCDSGNSSISIEFFSLLLYLIPQITNNANHTSTRKSKAQNSQGITTTYERDSKGACLTAMGLELSVVCSSGVETKKYTMEGGPDTKPFWDMVIILKFRNPKSYTNLQGVFQLIRRKGQSHQKKKKNGCSHLFYFIFFPFSIFLLILFFYFFYFLLFLSFFLFFFFFNFSVEESLYLRSKLLLLFNYPIGPSGSLLGVSLVPRKVIESLKLFDVKKEYIQSFDKACFCQNSGVLSAHILSPCLNQPPSPFYF